MPSARPARDQPTNRRLGLRLTSAGWLILAASIALVVLGRILGVYELFLVGVAGLALVVISAVLVGRSRPDLDVQRVLHPPRTHAGGSARVDVRIRNRKARRSPVVLLHDPVTGTGGADLHVGPLARGGAAAATYQLPTEHRGVITVGPLSGAIVDPFGIAERRFPVSGTSELTVLPRTYRVLALRRTIGLDDPHAGEQQANVLGLAGEEFYALRDYVFGDDMRRVHWPSTARRDELTVREAEVPWQGRTSVVLDARMGTTTAESFELGVSAAASIISAAARQDDRARLMITDGTDSGYADTHLHVDNIMERLAIVERHHGGTLADLAPTLERGQSGAIVVVTSAPTRYDIEALLNLRVRFGVVTVVLIHRSALHPRTGDHQALDLPATTRDLRLVHVTKDAPFPTAWNTAMSNGRIGVAL